jgi:uncharacterized membrane protein YhaH (DUF805 family)
MMTHTHYIEKINTLWTVFLLGTLFHTHLGLMPLFHGLSVAHSEVQGNADVSWVFWLMLIFFVIPLGLMTLNVFVQSKRYRQFHFGLTLFYSVMNFFHAIADLMVRPIISYQVTLMLLLFLIGVLLNWVAYQWVLTHPQKTVQGMTIP